MLLERYVVGHLLAYGIVGVHLREPASDGGLSEQEPNRWLVPLIGLCWFRDS